MASPFSVDDAFTVGVSFDLLGGFLLGRGLLVKPQRIAVRTTHVPVADHLINASEALAQIESRADAISGLTSLGIGFMLQAGGYVALIAGAKLHTGGTRALLAVVLMLVAAGLVYAASRGPRRKRVLRLTVEVARANPWTGALDRYPDEQTLIALGRQLGFPFIEVTEERELGDASSYAREHFGVGGLSRRDAFTMGAPGRR
jgi:hypothetical protein